MESIVKKLIVLPPVSEVAHFDITTVDGRDQIAEQIHADIDEYCRQQYDDGPRSHLGASVIGHACDAYIWFHFRWAKIEKFSGKKLRLFNRGHKEEDRIIEWLRGIGFEITQVDVDGQQLRIAKRINGHFGGSRDGGTKLPARYGNFPDAILLEFKTANAKGFEKVSSMGVVKGNERYYSQMCVYGYDQKIRYVLFICVGKNDDDLDVELLELNWNEAMRQMERADRIVNSPVRPKRLHENPAMFECKYCPMLGICHLNEPLDKNCRSCQFAQPVADGQWHCHNYNQLIPKEYISQGCNAWRGLQR